METRTARAETLKWNDDEYTCTVGVSLFTFFLNIYHRYEPLVLIQS